MSTTLPYPHAVAEVLILDRLQPGVDWVHASISNTARMPSYADLKRMHLAVFGNGWAYQVFAPPSDHINLHEYCLHLFGRLDGKSALPDFTQGSGSI